MKNFIVAIALIVLSILMSGFLLMKAWNWFLPTIFDVNTISFAHAMCLSFVLACTKSIRKTDSKKSNTDDILIAFGEVTLIRGFLLLLGWILYLLLI